MKISIIICILLVGIFSQVQQITLDNFNSIFDCPYEQFARKNVPLHPQWFVMFYTPWCGHCKRARPAFTNFQFQIRRNITESSKQKGLTDAQDIQIQIENAVHIGLVNCDEQKTLCKYFGIRGYPTFLYLTKERKAISYRGPRSVQQFMNFTLNHNPDQVQTAQQHPIDVDIFQTLKMFFGNQIFLFVSFFLIFPFFFGFCYMKNSCKPDVVKQMDKVNQEKDKIIQEKNKTEMEVENSQAQKQIQQSDSQKEKQSKKNV